MPIAYATAPNATQTEKYPASRSMFDPEFRTPRSSRTWITRRWSSTAGITDGSIMAIIIAVHMTRNIAACATSDWLPMLIHAIDIDHPPGMGIDADIAPALEMVYVQAAAVAIAATAMSTHTCASLAPDSASDGCIEDLDEVHDAHRPARRLQAGGDLQQAPGIARHDRFRIGFQNIAHLSIAELCCGVRLQHVVDAGRPAADLRFGYLAQLETRDRLQQPARLRAYTLRMLQVTRVVIRGLQLNGAPGRARLELCQDFGNVLALRGEGSGFRCVRRIVAKQVPVSLHRRAAAGSIDDDRIGAASRRTRR